MLALFVAAPSSCGGGSAGPSSSNGTFQPSTTAISTPNLTESDVNTIVLQAQNEALARGKPATIAVVDRVGNVLTVDQMAGAPTGLTVTSNRGVMTGLENQAIVPPGAVPTTMGAIAKALTGAYLSSNGNAFTTRTANQIIQEHFNPGVANTPGGPLFGVQFSQLPCSDFNTVASGTPGTTNAGPHRSPLGFAADSGGLPIYKNGILVGGIGIMSKPTYSLDANIFDVDVDDDEVIALAGTSGYDPPQSIRADSIAINGVTFRYTDASRADLAAPVSATGSYTSVGVPGYFSGAAAGHTAVGGLTYASTDGATGIVPDGTFGPVIYPGTTTPSYVFTDGMGNVLYAPTNGITPAGNAITAAEAQQLMTSALNVAYSGRAAIRNPTNSFIQVTVTIVDTDGNVVAQARTPDAPVFGADVSRQKARTAAFFSRPDAAAKILGITATSPSTVDGTFGNYIARSRALVGQNVFADGTAWSEVAIGDLARPFYPDGIDANPPGPLSLPFDNWSVFSDGLQLDLVAFDILQGVLTGARPAAGCAATGIGGTILPPVSGGKTQLADGLQIFSGGTPLYRGSTLVGAVGVSGDGIQQDTMISYLGIQNGPSSLNNAPESIRSDQITAGGVRLRYVNCPAAPFLNSNVQNPC